MKHCHPQTSWDLYSLCEDAQIDGPAYSYEYRDGKYAPTAADFTEWEWLREKRSSLFPVVDYRLYMQLNGSVWRVGHAAIVLGVIQFFAGYIEHENLAEALGRYAKSLLED